MKLSKPASPLPFIPQGFTEELRKIFPPLLLTKETEIREVLYQAGVEAVLAYLETQKKIQRNE